MSKTFFAGIAFGLTLFTAQSSLAQITKSGTGYLFRMKFTKGQTMNYNMATKSTVEGLGKPSSASAPISMVVTDVKGNVATIKYKITPPTAGAKPQNLTIKMDNTGKVVGGSNAATSMSGLSATLPLKPVPVGGTWTNKTSVPAGPSGTMDVNNTYKLLGFKTVKGKQMANIGLTMVGKAGGMGISGSGTMQLLVADGSLLDSVLAMNMTMAGQGSKPMKVAVNVNLTRK